MLSLVIRIGVMNLNEEYSVKEKVFMVCAIFVLVVSVVGISYAAFSYTKTGVNLNSITTGVLSMSYEESSNVISIDKSLPTTDATGTIRLKTGEYFDFTVTGKIQGSANINWEIAAEDVTTSSRKIDGKYINLYLTEIDSAGNEVAQNPPDFYAEGTTPNQFTGAPAGVRMLASYSDSSSFSRKYRLRMYVNDKYNPQGDGGNLQFSVRINVYGKEGAEPGAPS